MHAGQHDHISVGLRGLGRQRQTVADDVGHAVEDLRRLVVVGQDDRVPLPLQAVDLVHERSVEGPFHGGDHALHALIDRPRGLGDVGCVGESAGGGHDASLNALYEQNHKCSF